MNEKLIVNFEKHEKFIKESFIKDDKPLVDELISHFKNVEKKYPANYKDYIYCFILKVSGNLKRQEPNIKTIKKEILVCIDKSLNDSLPDILGFYEKEFFEEVINYCNLSKAEKLESYIYSLFSELNYSLKDNPYLQKDESFTMLNDCNHIFFIDLTSKIFETIEENSEQERMISLFVEQLRNYKPVIFKEFMDYVLSEYIMAKQKKCERIQMDNLLKIIPAFNENKVYNLCLENSENMIEIIKNSLDFHGKIKNTQPTYRNTLLYSYMEAKEDLLDYIQEFLMFRDREDDDESLSAFRDDFSIESFEKNYYFEYFIGIYYERLRFTLDKLNDQQQEDLDVILIESEEDCAAYFFDDDDNLERLVFGVAQQMETEKEDLLIDCKNKAFRSDNPDIYSNNPHMFIENYNFINDGLVINKKYNQKELIDLFYNIFYKVFDYQDGFYINSQNAYYIYFDYIYDLLSKDKINRKQIISEAIQEYYFQRILMGEKYEDIEEEKMLNIFKEKVSNEEIIRKTEKDEKMLNIFKEKVNNEEIIRKAEKDKKMLREIFTVYADYYLYEEERSLVESSRDKTYQKMMRRKRESN